MISRPTSVAPCTLSWPRKILAPMPGPPTLPVSNSSMQLARRSLPCGTAQQCCPRRAGLPARCGSSLQRNDAGVWLCEYPGLSFQRSPVCACSLVSSFAPQRGYDEPAILSYAISSFCPTSADGLQSLTSRRTAMARKRYKPEEIVAKLRQVDVLVSQGQTMVDAIRQIGVSEVTYYRWRQEFGGLKSEQVKRLKDLEL